MANAIINIYISNIHKRIQFACMNTILNMMSALYYFVIESFLLPNNFNTKILNQFIVNYKKFINNHHTNS